NAVVNEMAVSGDILYTTSTDGLTTYKIGSLVTIPVTASVEVPAGTEVAGSYNVPPTQIIHGKDFDTLVWKMTLAYGESDPTFTWKTTVSNLGAGEVRVVTLGTSLAFVSQGTPGTLSLPATDVTGVPIIRLTPSSLTARPGETVDYDLRLTN